MKIIQYQWIQAFMEHKSSKGKALLYLYILEVLSFSVEQKRLLCKASDEQSVVLISIFVDPVAFPNMTSDIKSTFEKRLLCFLDFTLDYHEGIACFVIGRHQWVYEQPILTAAL